MYVYKKILLISLMISAPLFAFDFGNKFNQLTDNLSNDLFDKTVDSVTGNGSNNTNKKTTSNKMEQMEELTQMRKKGYITESEYRTQKRIILNN